MMMIGRAALACLVVQLAATTDIFCKNPAPSAGASYGSPSLGFVSVHTDGTLQEHGVHDTCAEIRGQ